MTRDDDELDPAPDEFDDPEAEAAEDDIEDDPSHNPPEELDRLRGA